MPNRYYQDEAVRSIFDYWERTPGNPLVDMATGTGKSRTMAMFDSQLIDAYPDLRIVNATHVVELVEGNFRELVDYSPFAPAGIFASSLGQRNARAQIVFGQIQTVYNKAREIGHVDVLKIDEAHLVPMSQTTQYRGFISDLLAINPEMKICGFTATPYRLDSGRLDEGEDKIFDDIVYTYNIRNGIDDGYLTPITSTPTGTKQDISGVGKAMGDYKKGALQKAVDKDELNKRILEEVFDVEWHRRKTLFFCAGVEHATNVRDLVREMGRSCEVIHGGTPIGERRAIIEAYKRGDIWGVTNDNVMSTGTNVPGIDCIVDMAPTASASRYVQRVGRGTRVIYPPRFDPEAVDAAARRAAIASYIKPNCRYMDFAGNLNRHGPVDMIEPKRPGKGDGEAPIKICPQDAGGCGEQLHASVRQCWNCGHEFPEPQVKISERSSDAPIISTAEAAWRPVTSRTFRFHEAKDPSKLPSVKVSYLCGLTTVNEWLCPQHTGYAQSKAHRWWTKHGGQRPFPKTVLEWLQRQNELLETAEISVAPSGKYLEVKDHKPGSERADNDNEMPADYGPQADNDNQVAHFTEEDWDAIPF